MQGLFRKYYATDDVLCDAASSAIDEKLQNAEKGCFAGNNTTIAEVADLLGWLHRRDESGFTNTLIRELECIDKAEY